MKPSTLSLVGSTSLALFVSCAMTTTSDGLEEEHSLITCDAHDLPFLATHEDKHPADVPPPPGTVGLNRIPMLVAKPAPKPTTLSRTGWNNASGVDWSVGLRAPLDAISLGLDWLLLEEVYSDETGDLTHWRPEPTTSGFGAMFFVIKGAVYAYGWGPDLDKLFTYDTAKYERVSGLLHSSAALETDVGGTLIGVDYNGGFYDVWKHSDCFPAPTTIDKDKVRLFYSRPGELLYMSVATRTPGTESWTWTTGAEVRLMVVTTGDPEPLFPAGSGADITSLAYDSTHNRLMFSLAGDSTPFYVSEVEETVVSAEGVVEELLFTEPKPLFNHSGDPFASEFFPDRPSGSCGVDPKYFSARQAKQDQ